jgi:hypothetical protein
LEERKGAFFKEMSCIGKILGAVDGKKQKDL